jgi:cob(I)alamin adenosyltransferase
MGNRLTAIATRTGDAGTTGLGDNTRVSKAHLRVRAMGDVDELNSTLGLLLCESLPADIALLLTQIQHDLFDLGGELAVPGYDSMKEAQLIALDEALAHYNASLPPLKEFILPGGKRTAALAHIARTVARRAERTIVSLAAEQPLRALLQQYLNRLSDLMFVLARSLNRVDGGDDVYWKSKRLAAEG